ncbi:MAG: hypothetical protein RLZ33_2478 [Bacteroidota bacterium]|jgi:hypothetical protein
MKPILTFFLLITLFACSPQSKEANRIVPTKQTQLEDTLQKLADGLEFKNYQKLKNCTTENGYRSLLSWSDSLKDRTFIHDLKMNLKKYAVANLKDWEDTMVIIYLGKQDEVLGTTGGFVVFKRINQELKIDEFRGGK